MPQRAHNSKFPEDFIFEGKKYSGPTDLYRAAFEHKVKLSTFTGRLRKRLSEGELSDELIREALYTDPYEYKHRYGVRKTWIDVNGKSIDLESYHKAESSRAVCSYRTFWQRLKKRTSIDQELLEHALTFSTEDWISFYGGGRHRNFVYQGDLYPEHIGEAFHGISAFLKRVDRYSDKSTVWSRIKAGWSLDDALFVSTDFKTARHGRIYQITRKKNGQVYIGLTHSSIDQRWAFHISAARKGSSTKIATAIRNDGSEGFSIEIIEDNIEEPEELKKREVYWVKIKRALGPQGLNIAPPGVLGSSKGIPFEWEGERFESKSEAARVLGDRFNVPYHVVERRIREGKPLRGNARKNSKNKDAGSNLFRRWLALKKRHISNIDSNWMDYDRFKADVGADFDSELKLIRLDSTKPWGTSNWKWGTTQEMIESTHGKSFTVNDVTYPSLRAVAEKFDIGYSTLKNRIGNQGLTWCV